MLDNLGILNATTKKCTHPKELNLLTSTINVIHGLSSLDKNPLDHQWYVHPLVHMQLYKEFSSSWEAEAAAAAMLRRGGREGPEGEGADGRRGGLAARGAAGARSCLGSLGSGRAAPTKPVCHHCRRLRPRRCTRRSRRSPRGRDLGAPAGSRVCGAAAVCRLSPGAPGPRGGSAAPCRARPTHAGFIFRKS